MSTLFAILSRLIRVYTVPDSLQSGQVLHYLPFAEVWSRSRSTVILRNSLIRVYTTCHSQQLIMVNTISHSFYHDLHCLPFFHSSFIKIYTVCHFQLSDQCLHYQLFSAVWSGSTLFPTLSRLIKVYIICHSEQSVQGLHYLPFSAVLSRSTLFAILSSLISVYTICHSQPSDRHVLPFSVWSGSTLSAILSLKRVKTIRHSQQSNQGLHYLPFSLSSIIRVYTVSHSQLSDQGLHYLLFSAVWSGSTLFAILSTLIPESLPFPFLAFWSGTTLFAILSSLIRVYTICRYQFYQGLHYFPF